MDDTVIFMSAYNPTHYKSKNWFYRCFYRLQTSRDKKRLQSLLQKYHLTYLATDEKIITVDKKLDLKIKYDYIHQASIFDIPKKNKEKKENINSIDGIGVFFHIRHALAMLLDDYYFKIEFAFGFEPFLVWIDKMMYQVDSFVFMMNGMFIILFEIIDYKTGKPLTKDQVNAKRKNFNLLSVEKFQFFNEDSATECNSQISEIIYNKTTNFMTELIHKKYYPDAFSFAYNTVILSNEIKEPCKYICDFMGLKHPVSPIKDISTVKTYDYYPQEGLSVITNYNVKELEQVLYPALMLESVKLYIYVFQTSNLHEERENYKTIHNNIYLRNLFYSPHCTIETYNLLNFIKESEPYKNAKEATELKIKSLTLENDLKKNRNSSIMNILLYLISLLGIISNLDTIEEHYGIPFNYSLIVVAIICVLGLIPLIKEYFNNKSC